MRCELMFLNLLYILNKNIINNLTLNYYFNAKEYSTLLIETKDIKEFAKTMKEKICSGELSYYNYLSRKNPNDNLIVNNDINNFTIILKERNMFNDVLDIFINQCNLSYNNKDINAITTFNSLFDNTISDDDPLVYGELSKNPFSIDNDKITQNNANNVFNRTILSKYNERHYLEDNYILECEPEGYPHQIFPDFTINATIDNENNSLMESQSNSNLSENQSVSKLTKVNQ